VSAAQVGGDNQPRFSNALSARSFNRLYLRPINLKFVRTNRTNVCARDLLRIASRGVLAFAAGRHLLECAL
jgi:hypothetical protein